MGHLSPLPFPVLCSAFESTLFRKRLRKWDPNPKVEISRSKGDKMTKLFVQEPGLLHLAWTARSDLPLPDDTVNQRFSYLPSSKRTLSAVKGCSDWSREWLRGTVESHTKKDCLRWTEGEHQGDLVQTFLIVNCLPSLLLDSSVQEDVHCYTVGRQVEMR